MDTSLNSYEMQLVTDPNILFAKNKVVQIVCTLFAQLSEDYKKVTGNKINEEISVVNGKIAKGENYQGLPYVILDYPRQFSKTNTFAIRSFFWWGNFFSITLHLTGQYQRKYTPILKHAIEENYFSGWSISVSKDQWKHDFDRENYIPVEEHMHYNIVELPFIKLAKKIPLNEWDEAYSFFTANFILLIKALEAYAPIR
jgi:hypothetical protein